MLSLTIDSVTVEQADAYAASRGRASWVSAPSEPPTAKEAAIRRATDWMAGEFNSRWLVDFGPDDVPEPVRFAISEAAIRELAVPGSLAPDYVPAQRVLNRRVDVISITYADPKSPDDMLPVMRIIDGLLSGLVKKKSATSVVAVGRA
ncbi:MAG: DnaT-like ssDNA-binding protein [Brevundimonas sp.]|uniref:DnaT-like ssDNA-binding protein n=1 Tax=Brevundimonas sp. TaxID=1871086 RepID=UPI00391C8019